MYYIDTKAMHVRLGGGGEEEGGIFVDSIFKS
jgi:hypothetical protein